MGKLYTGNMDERGNPEDMLTVAKVRPGKARTERDTDGTVTTAPAAGWKPYRVTSSGNLWSTGQSGKAVLRTTNSAGISAEAVAHFAELVRTAYAGLSETARKPYAAIIEKAMAGVAPDAPDRADRQTAAERGALASFGHAYLNRHGIRELDGQPTDSEDALDSLFD